MKVRETPAPRFNFDGVAAQTPLILAVRPGYLREAVHFPLSVKNPINRLIDPNSTEELLRDLLFEQKINL